MRIWDRWLCGFALCQFSSYFIHYLYKKFNHKFPRRKKISWRTISLISAILSLLSKETGISALVINLTFTIFREASIKSPSISPKRIPIDIFSFVCLLVSRLAIQKQSLPEFSEPDNPAAFHPDSTTRLYTFLYLPSVSCSRKFERVGEYYKEAVEQDPLETLQSTINARVDAIFRSKGSKFALRIVGRVSNSEVSNTLRLFTEKVKEVGFVRSESNHESLNQHSALKASNFSLGSDSVVFDVTGEPSNIPSLIPNNSISIKEYQNLLIGSVIRSYAQAVKMLDLDTSPAVKKTSIESPHIRKEIKDLAPFQPEIDLLSSKNSILRIESETSLPKHSEEEGLFQRSRSSNSDNTVCSAAEQTVWQNKTR
ncbi:TMTC [Lepeophtheirus salmonis]|uniref:TMTC n=1 Tax=Lepeophtheirus salmonis TaxID=72036 RepID=A0A7R8H8B1_LEPSM|nr:TMTC [Lepeophtheirus salmonis]CAF2935186.1 TMTC [Lepeophtheirus salmonis]